MSLGLSPSQNTISQLEEALDLYDSELAEDVPRLKRYLRAAAIQAFEFTYELSFKMIKRYLELASANPTQIDNMSFNDVIREALRQSLVHSDLRAWKEYRRKRGMTSHAYDEKKAQAVLDGAPDFLEEADYLLKQLQEKNEALD